MATDFIPALRFAALTPWYDRTVAWSTREADMKRRVVALAAPRPGERVLDLGCGTGTLLLALANAAPSATLTGIDADPEILTLAATKTQAAGVEARLVPAWSHALPFAEARFDVAVSTLFFHHLQPHAKHRTVQELWRVLRPGGRLVIADFGRAAAGWRRGLFHLVRLLDGYSNTRDHAAGTLASFLLDGGFVDVQSLTPLPVPLGSIDFLVATRPPRPQPDDARFVTAGRPVVPPAGRRTFEKGATTMRPVLRVTAYPVVFGLSFWAVLEIVARPAWQWPGLAAVAVAAMTAVAALEWVIPYQRAWLEDHDDLATDIAHALVNLAVLAGTAFALNALRVDLPSVWPDAWPAWAQVLLAGAVMDLGLYLMHRASHHVGWMWRLHAPHHSSERLYWLNGERRHPLSAMLLASPGLLVVVALGAPPVIISAWLTLLAVHLAFQHANLDYRMGPLRYVLGVAEIHRWHHKREYEDAQVNFGEFWMLWDHLGRTFHDRPNGVVAGEVGLRDRTFPTAYGAQLRWPFERPASAPTATRGSS